MTKKKSGGGNTTGASGNIPFKKTKLPPDRAAFLKSLRGRLDTIFPHMDANPDFRERVVAGAMSDVAKQVLPERIISIKKAIGPKTMGKLRTLSKQQNPPVDLEDVLAAFARHINDNALKDVLEEPENLATAFAA